ncbi:electron-transferring-flavoprotein dehydrogenase [Alteromonadaceae bacterium 2753L.S.0a.02]|nr:electron-transferring-flavoprotein dehydrogenase [Alteromonadaceae bacterium 2753L.S.0a.02]
MEYDVVVVGAGPAGLSAACRLKQLNPETNVCVVEKGSEVGAHILSGAVFEPSALNELFEDWANNDAPLLTPVSEDRAYLLRNDQKAIKIPNMFVPKTMHNTGNFVISLGNLCRWLADQAETLGVEIFPGFTAAELAIGDDGAVKGVITGDMGVSADGSHKDSYMAGMVLLGRYTLLAEGCRGHLGKKAIRRFGLDEAKQAQHYGLGLKELWKIPAEKHKPGLVIHTAGWPLAESQSAGGGFLYHLENNQVAVGLITDLSYSNPHLSPYDEFQRYKHHPVIKGFLDGGERIAYGARALVKGGLQALPQMHFPGGILLGDDAGTLNFAKIKGTHTAMKSGMLAAETVHEALQVAESPAALANVEERFKKSWAYRELHLQRNFGPAQHRWGNLLGSAYAFIDINICNGALPWTLQDPTPDHETLKRADTSPKINYPKPDGKISFDKLSSVYLSNTNHEEDQPCHLQLSDPGLPISENLPLYNEPAQRYCPAGVYEVITEGGEPRFQINAQNCVHCKTCDIKDPLQNITWVCPEGGGGPNYPNM